MQSKPYPQANSQKSDIKRSETVNLVHLSPPDDEGRAVSRKGKREFKLAKTT